MFLSFRRPYGSTQDFKNSFRLRLIFTLAIACLSAVGCSRTSSDARQEPGRPTAGRIAYTDGLGRKVELPSRPQRIISLAPNITETIYLVGAQDRLIGVTIQCEWPDEAKKIPRIGDLLNPNYEVILAAKPDLIIASTAGNDRGAVMKLSDLGLPVYIAAPRNVENIFKSVEEIGRITDCYEQGRQVVTRMRERLEAIKLRIAGLPPVRAFFITWLDPLLAPGKNTFENDALSFAGVVSITADIPQYYPRYSLEQLLVKDPDVIITVKQEGNPIPDFRKIAGWQNLRAVRQGRVYVLTEYLQHPSPLFVDGVEELAKKLYPERFP